MHGSGVAPGIDRYLVEGTPSCATCHPPSDPEFMAATLLHLPFHTAAMDCQVCHAQPSKSCFGCHTDVNEAGRPFFRINESDPTRLARQGTAATPPAGDSLMVFRAGRNPRFGEPGQKRYAVLRHAPIDADLFRYGGALELDGLVPALADAPTWKYATPHNIARVTPIQSSCANCHDADYAKFWLTDAVLDAYGWVGDDPAAQEAEAEANALVIQPTPLPLP
jgi:hypothetical protein